jgi:tetratricopeptide (TPR) repeat protein
MISALLGVVLVVTMAQADAPSVSLSDADTVKQLYVSAAYEEALRHLDAMDASQVTEQLDQYRALSLLALGRNAEAEQAFDRMVRRAPLYRIGENDVSPRIAAMFTDVRRRVLPAVARDMYLAGKSSFDQKHYGEADRQMKALIAVLADPDMTDENGAVDDLRQLADGFMRLSEIELENARKAAEAAAAPPPPRPAPVTPADPAPTVTRIVIYSAGDSGVTPPVELERRMPPWTPPPIIARNAQFRGVLDVVVNEAGAVESATMDRPTMPSYDLTLLDAARRWRYTPAMSGTQPVKYRLEYNVVLAPPQ